MEARVVESFDAQTHLSALLDEVEQGGEVLICKRGVPVARLVPAEGAEATQVAEAIAALRKLRENLRLGLNWRELREAGLR